MNKMIVCELEKISAKCCSNAKFGCKVALLITYDECHGLLTTFAVE